MLTEPRSDLVDQMLPRASEVDFSTIVASEQDEATRKAMEEAAEAERQAKLAEARFQAALKSAQEAAEEEKRYYIPGVGDDDDDDVLIRKGRVKQMVADIERLRHFKKARKKAKSAQDEVDKQLSELEIAREAYKQAQAARKAAYAEHLAALARANEDLRTMSDDERHRRLTKFQQSILDKQREYEDAAQEAARKQALAEERRAAARQAQMELMAIKYREAKEREAAAKLAEEERKRVRARSTTLISRMVIKILK